MGNDLRQGVFTLPLVLALQQDDGKLAWLLSEPPYTGEQVERIIEPIGRLGGLKGARQIAGSCTRGAPRDIQARDILTRTVRKLLELEY